MRPASVGRLACPYCRGELSLKSEDRDPVQKGKLMCTLGGHEFVVDDGIPRLLRSEDQERFKKMEAELDRFWHLEGWVVSNPRDMWGIPYKPPLTKQWLSWKVKARSLDRLKQILVPEEYITVLDAGAGNCWLSFRLAQCGHSVLAMDTNVGLATGLSAGAIYLQKVDFDRVQGSMTSPPLKPASFDAVVCSSSLHHLGNPREPLRILSELLRPRGLLVVLNSPIHRDPGSSRRAEAERRSYLREKVGGEWIDNYVHFTLSVLLSAMDAAGLSEIDVIEPDFDTIFRMERRLKSFLLNMEVASFPIIVAKKLV